MIYATSRVYLRVPGGNVYGTWEELKGITASTIEQAPASSFSIIVQIHYGTVGRLVKKPVRFEQLPIEIALVDTKSRLQDNFPIAVFSPIQELSASLSDQLRSVLLKYGKCQRCYGYNIPSSLSRL